MSSEKPSIPAAENGLAVERPWLSNEVGRAVTEAFARHHAIVVAVNEYGEPSLRLRNAVADGQGVAALLETTHGFEVTQLFDGDATSQRVRALLEEELPKRVGPDDRVIVYFACHGTLTPTDQGPMGYLLVHGARRGDSSTYYPMQEMSDALSRLTCRHLLVVLDCCFAGAFHWASHRDIAAARIYREQFARYLNFPAWQVLTSASSDETALDADPDNRDDDGGHSPFARALLEGLGGKADLIEDGVIVATELYLYLRSKLEKPSRHSRGQTPGIFPLAKHGRGEFLFARPGEWKPLDPVPKLGETDNPYRGLQAFDTGDHELFFGRTRVIASLVQAVAERRLTVVLGASGIGKSSLVRAGLIPSLADSEWTKLPPTRPGERPDLALQQAIDALPSGDGRCLLFIDQLEEVLTLTIDEEARVGFETGLTKLLEDRPSVHVVMTLRSDYEPSFAHGAFAARWKEARFVVPPMTREELREAIEKPAEKRVLYFEAPELVDRLIDEVALMPGALPLLSFTLSELFRKYLESPGTDRALTEEAYREIGGVTASVTAAASREMDALKKTDARYAATVRLVMLRLVSVEGGEPVRRRVSIDELVVLDPEKNNRRRIVVERFLEARLLVAGAAASDAAPTAGAPGSTERLIEPAHDVLVAGWDRMRAWLKAYSTPISLLRELRVRAAQWNAASRSAVWLWPTDPRLPQLVVVARDEDSLLNGVEGDFVKASEQARRRRLRTIIGSVAGAMALLSLATVIALFQWSEAKKNALRATANESRANQKAQEAQAQTLRAEKQRRLELARTAALVSRSPESTCPGLALALDALDPATEPDPPTTQALFDALQAGWCPRHIEHHETVETPTTVSSVDLAAKVNRAVSTSASEASVWSTASSDRFGSIRTPAGAVFLGSAISPDGLLVLTIFYNPGARAHITPPVLWNADTGAEIARLDGHGSQLTSVVFSPDGNEVATTSYDGIVRLWDGHTGQPRGQLTELNRVLIPPNTLIPSSTVQFSSDGTALVTSHSASQATLWKASDHSRLATVRESDGNRILSTSISADGSRILTRTGRGVSMWSGGDRVSHVEGRFFTAAIASDGSAFVTGADDGAVVLWRASVPAMATNLMDHGMRISRLACDAGCARVVSASEDGTARVWDGGNGRQIAVLRHKGPITDLAMSKDGNTVVTSSQDGTAIAWRMPAGRRTFAIAAPTLTYGFMTTDGKRALLDKGDSSALVDVSSGAPLKTLTHPHAPRVYQASPDGRLIVIGDGHKVRVWKASDGTLSASLVFQGILDEVMFDPSSSRFAITDQNEQIVSIYDAKTLEHEEISGGKDFVRGAGFDSTGTRFLTAGYAHDFAYGTDFPVLLTPWDLTPMGPVALHGYETTNFHYSPATRILSPDLFVTNGDKTAPQLISPSDGKISATLSGHMAKVSWVELSPSNDRVVTASDDQTAGLWDLHGKRIASLPHSDAVRLPMFSNDGTRFATVDGRSARVWRSADGTLLAAVPVDGSFDVRFGKDGNRILVLRGDRADVAGKSGRALVDDIVTDPPEMIRLGCEALLASVPDGSDVDSEAREACRKRIADPH